MCVCVCVCVPIGWLQGFQGEGVGITTFCLIALHYPLVRTL